MKTKLSLAISLAVVIGFTNVGRANLIDVYATSFPGGNPTLETVNLATGNVTPLGTVNWGGIINDVAQDPLTGTLYGLSGANLFTINLSGNVGAVTPVNTTGMNGSMETLAFNSSGDLYIGTQASLYKFNFSTPGTGAHPYRQLLRYRSSVRYGDGDPRPVIDAEMPAILRHLPKR